MVKKINYVDVEMGILGAFGMGISIFVINFSGGLHRAIMAGALQFVYSLFVISFTTYLCRLFVKRSIFLAVMVPTTVTTILTYIVHIIGKSPEPFNSAVFSFVIAIVSFIPIAYRFQKTEASIVDLVKGIFKK